MATRCSSTRGHRSVLMRSPTSRLAASESSSGDLSSAAGTRSIAVQVNAMGRMDAVIHNAGIYRAHDRAPTPEGHASILAINALAPYLLTALIERPDRLVYLSSSEHFGGE